MAEPTRLRATHARGSWTNSDRCLAPVRVSISFGFMDEIRPGAQIEVTDAAGRRFTKYAVSAVERSGAFPVVWACSVDEWDDATEESREPDAEPFPWPLRSIRALTPNT